MALPYSETWSALDQLDIPIENFDASMSEMETLNRINSRRENGKWNVYSTGGIAISVDGGHMS